MRYFIILVMWLLVGCGGGSPVIDPPVDPPTDPPVDPPVVKTMDGNWQLTARGEVLEGWPATFTLDVYGGNNGATLTLPDVIGDSIRDADVTLRINRSTETAQYAWYFSDQGFTMSYDWYSYVTFDYFKTGTGDYLTINAPLSETEFVAVVYDAVKL